MDVWRKYRPGNAAHSCGHQPRSLSDPTAATAIRPNISLFHGPLELAVRLSLPRGDPDGEKYDVACTAQAVQWVTDLKTPVAGAATE